MLINHIAICVKKRTGRVTRELLETSSLIDLRGRTHTPSAISFVLFVEPTSTPCQNTVFKYINRPKVSNRYVFDMSRFEFEFRRPDLKVQTMQ